MSAVGLELAKNWRRIGTFHKHDRRVSFAERKVGALEQGRQGERKVGALEQGEERETH